LKILFITAWYPTEENPVNGVFVREYAKAVSTVGDEVVVIHSQRAKTRIRGLYHYSDTLEDGIRTIRISYFRSPFRTINYLIYLLSIFKMSQRIIREGFKPDIVHAHIFSAGVPSVLIGKIYRIPVVTTEHSSAFPMRTLSRFDILQARIAFGCAEKVLPVSHSLQKGIESYGIRDHFQIVPNAVDTSFFFPSPKLQEAHDIKRILFVGSLIPNKGILYLLQGLKRIKQKREDWHTDIIGDGPKRVEYERLAVDLGLADKITFHGLKSRYETAKFMRQTDFFILPSLFETFSVVTAEALVSGTPVLVTRSGGPDEFVTEDVGLLIPPGNIDALFNGLDYMLNQFERFKSNQISTYATERFSLQRVGEQLNKIYLECIKKYKNRYGNTTEAKTH